MIRNFIAFASVKTLLAAKKRRSQKSKDSMSQTRLKAHCTASGMEFYSAPDSIISLPSLQKQQLVSRVMPKKSLATPSLADYDYQKWLKKPLNRRESLNVDPPHPKYPQQMSYSIFCGDRLLEARLRYNKQLRYEMKQIMNNQTKASEVLRFSRYMSYTTLWPPYHTRREIQQTSATMFKLTEKQRDRLRYIMANKIQ